MPLNTTQKVKVALMITCIVALGALTYFWVVSQQGSGYTQDSGDFEIRLLNNYGNVVVGANVSLSVEGVLNRSGRTDSWGIHIFQELPWNSYNLTIETNEYQPFSITITFEHPQVGIYNLSYRTFRLTINATDALTGEGVSNASVQLYRYNYYNAYESIIQGTNGSGFTTFASLEYDEYALVMSHELYSNASQLLFLISDSQVDLQLQPIPGPPAAPHLQLISPDPSNGTIYLSWTDLADAGLYYLFRDTVLITSTIGKTPLAVVLVSDYTDMLTANGTFFYAVVACNGKGNSSLSNCVGVTVLTTVSHPFHPFSPLFQVSIVVGLISGAVIATALVQRRNRVRNADPFLKKNTFTGEVPDATPGLEPTSMFDKYDRFEVITYSILILFYVAVFANLGFISTTATFEQRIMALQYLGIAALGTAGLAVRMTLERVEVWRGPDAQNAGVLSTPTIYESQNASSIFQSLFYFGIAFGAQALMSAALIMTLPLSVYGTPLWNVQMVVIGVIGAVGEELFFSYFLTGVLVQTKLRWGAIPLVSIVFVGYHFAVYQTLTALLYVGIMRLVYSTVYIFSRRLSSVTLAHVLNNLIVGLRM